MTRDPILDEIHETRELIWNEVGRDSKTLFRWLRKLESRHAERLVTMEQLEKNRKTAGKRRALARRN